MYIPKFCNYHFYLIFLETVDNTKIQQKDLEIQAWEFDFWTVGSRLLVFFGISNGGDPFIGQFHSLPNWSLFTILFTSAPKFGQLDGLKPIQRRPDLVYFRSGPQQKRCDRSGNSTSIHFEKADG